MSRYNGGTNGGSSDDNNDYDDQIELKIKEYSTVRLTPSDLNGNLHERYGQSFITNYSDAEILDGVVLQREDKPETWNVYSADKWFNLNPEDGLVYENFDEDDGYSGEMSAQDILDHPRVKGHSTSGGNDDYYFNPVGVVIEEAGDIAIADDADVEVTDEPAITVGEASTLVSKNSWTRTFAKKLSVEGDTIVNDNGEDPTPQGEDHDNPKYSSHDWLTTVDPTLRDDLDGRELELWVTRETNTFSDGETTYLVPNLMDVKTGEFVQIDNGVEGDDDGDSEKSEQATATDGGTKAESTSDGSTTETTESPDEPTTDADDNDLPENVPAKLDDLIGYMARNGDDNTAESVRDFAEDEVDSPEDVDWEAAAEAANERDE